VATDYLVPTSVEEAVSALAAAGDRRPVVVAGGTDVYPARVGRDVPEVVLDITRIGDLRGVEEVVAADGARWVRIGACTTWSDLVTADLPSGFAALPEVARQVGAVQVQNVGTIAGNLCTASPAGDGIPVLLALGAEIELRSSAETRRLALDDFVTGYRATALRPDELVVAVWLPIPDGRQQSVFVKFGTREYLVISLAMVAVSVVRTDDGELSDIRIAVGACSPVARRLGKIERLVLAAQRSGVPVAVTRSDCEELAPIDDVRCSADYRRDLVPELVGRALVACGVQVGERSGR